MFALALERKSASRIHGQCLAKPRKRGYWICWTCKFLHSTASGLCVTMSCAVGHTSSHMWNAFAINGWGQKTKHGQRSRDCWIQPVWISAMMQAYQYSVSTGSTLSEPSKPFYEPAILQGQGEPTTLSSSFIWRTYTCNPLETLCFLFMW